MYKYFSSSTQQGVVVRRDLRANFNTTNVSTSTYLQWVFQVQGLINYSTHMHSCGTACSQDGRLVPFPPIEHSQLPQACKSACMSTYCQLRPESVDMFHFFYVTVCIILPMQDCIGIESGCIYFVYVYISLQPGGTLSDSPHIFHSCLSISSIIIFGPQN